jgi:ubiquinone/menaquinone biosynthesis C-methylase UbiE
MNNDPVMARAARADFLDVRIAENTSAQQTDLNEWIFDYAPPKAGSHVLELCCGTGAQTKYLLRHVGQDGSVTAVDVSGKALAAVDTSTLSERRAKLTLVETELDSISAALEKHGLSEFRFDYIFCAYGLYYSKNATALLEILKRKLSPKGSIIIVGPFGPNNGFLFDFLSARGVKISDYVMHTSKSFMWTEVMPWATTRFRSMRVRTLTNAVRWKTAENVLSYWRNSTFFDETKNAAVAADLAVHFENHSEFVNEKWIMLLEVSDSACS